MNTEQVIIVGAGPAGLTAAIYTARAGLEPLVVAGDMSNGNLPGGQLMITTEVENFPGFPDGISGPQLIENMTIQATNFGTRIVEKFATEFQFGTRKGDKHLVKIGGEWYISPVVILANGARARWLGVKGEEKFINRGISACATCDGPLPYFRDKVIAVVGGGDSACEEALFLTKFAKKVVIIHRRDKLRASQIMQDRVLNNPKIEMMWDHVIVGYGGDENGNLSKVSCQSTKLENSFTDLECTGLFMAIGHTPNTNELETANIRRDKEGYILTSGNVHTCTTTVDSYKIQIPGVFTAGDCHDQRYRQAITAAGFGCMAAIEAERYLENLG